MISKQQMRQHIEHLTEDHEIAVLLIPKACDAWAIREADGAADEIAVPPVRSAVTYATALHEIGHILGRYQRSDLTMVRERWRGSGRALMRACGRQGWSA